jgi:hypothetical protein
LIGANGGTELSFRDNSLEGTDPVRLTTPRVGAPQFHTDGLAPFAAEIRKIGCDLPCNWLPFKTPSRAKGPEALPGSMCRDLQARTATADVRWHRVPAHGQS